MKYLFALIATIVVLLALASEAQAAEIKIKASAGLAFDNGGKTDEYSWMTNHKVGDMALYASYEFNPWVEVVGGYYHSSNPELPDGRSLAVTGWRVGINVTLLKVQF